MTTKTIIQELLAGAWISKRSNRRKGFGYALYKNNSELHGSISDIQFSTFKNVTKQKKGKITLNLNLVRQQHGNSLVKTLYKQSRKKLKRNDLS